MHYDIDNAIAKISGIPWELELAIDGKNWAVRPLQVADVDRLGQIGAQSREGQNETVRDLFVSPAPPVEDWSPAIVSHVVAAVLGYQRGRILKNSQAVVTEVATATMKS